MHVAQLLDPLLAAPDVEIVEAPLPELGHEMLGAKGKLKLSCRGRSLLAQPSRHALLEHLQHRRRRALGWLADQQMDVLGHHHEAHQGEAVSIANFAQNFDEQIAGAHGSQQCRAAVARKCNEVQIVLPVVALES